MKLPRDKIEQIKNMEGYVMPEEIAKTMELPVDVIHDVLRGNVKESSEIGTGKIKVVEKARVVRNKTVTAISPGGGKGKTTLLTSLGTAAAIHNPNRRPIGIVDLAEYSKVLTSMGYENNDLVMNIEAITNWDDQTLDWKEYTVIHPILENLYIMPGFQVADKFLELNENTFVDIINTFQHKFEITFIDLPAQFSLSEKILPHCDVVIIALTPDYDSIKGFIQLMPTINRLATGKAFIVLNRVGYEPFMDNNEFRRMLEKAINSHYTFTREVEYEFKGFIPETPAVVEKAIIQEDNLILSEPDSGFTSEINQVLSHICPDWQIKKPKKEGILNRLISGLSKG